MPEDKLFKLYNNMKSDNYELPDYNTFKNTLQTDPEKRTKLYNNLLNDNYDMSLFPKDEFDNIITQSSPPVKQQKPPKKNVPLVVNPALEMGYSLLGAYSPLFEGVMRSLEGTPVGTVISSIIQQPGSIIATIPNTIVSYGLSFVDANVKMSSSTGQKMVLNDALETGLKIGKFVDKIMSGDLFLPNNPSESGGDKIVNSVVNELRKDSKKIFNEMPQSSKVEIKALEKLQLENYAKIAEISKAFNEPFDTYKGEYKGSFWLDQVPGGISQTSAFVMMGYAAGAMGATPAIGTMLTGALAESGGQLPEAWDALQKNEEFKKLSDGDKARIMGQTNLYSAAAGTTEALPIEAQLESIGKLSAGIFKDINKSGLINKALSKEGLKTFRQYVKTGVIGGTEEFLQEGLQTGLENYTAQELYDASRKISDGMLEAAAVGGISGLVLSTFGLGISIRAKRTQDAEEKALLEKANTLVHDALQQSELKLQVQESQKVEAINIANGKAVQAVEILKEDKKGIVSSDEVYDKIFGDVVEKSIFKKKLESTTEFQDMQAKKIAENKTLNIRQAKEEAHKEFVKTPEKIIPLLNDHYLRQANIQVDASNVDPFIMKEESYGGIDANFANTIFKNSNARDVKFDEETGKFTGVSSPRGYWKIVDNLRQLSLSKGLELKVQGEQSSDYRRVKFEIVSPKGQIKRTTPEAKLAGRNPYYQGKVVYMPESTSTKNAMQGSMSEGVQTTENLSKRVLQGSKFIALDKSQSKDWTKETLSKRIASLSEEDRKSFYQELSNEIKKETDKGYTVITNSKGLENLINHKVEYLYNENQLSEDYNPETDVNQEFWNEEKIKGYTVDNTLQNSDGTVRLASTDKSGNIRIRTDFTPEFFWDYLDGLVPGVTSEQKKMVMQILDKKYHITPESLRSILDTKEKIIEFLYLHEFSHVKHKDTDVYWKNGTKDFLTQDKVDIEVRATKEAIRKLSPEAQILKSRTTEINYTGNQVDALLNIQDAIDFNQGEFILAGFAGTGKTTVVENIVTYARDKGKTPLVLAPTNKAVNRLREKLSHLNFLDLKIMHKFLYTPVKTDDGGVKFEIKQRGNSENNVIVIDESSMIDKQMLEDLRISVPSATIVFVGDDFQLPPVNDDPKLFANKSSQMTEVMRQALKNPVLKFATYLRINKVLSIPTESNGTLEVMEPDDFTPAFVEALKNGEDVVAVTATNGRRVKLNKIARLAVYGENAPVIGKNEKMISISNSDVFKNGESYIEDLAEGTEVIPITLQRIIGKTERQEIPAYYYERTSQSEEELTLSEYVIVIPDYAEASLYHGQIDARGLPSELTVTKKRYTNLSPMVSISTYGYAITAHKSQGSEWDKVFVSQDSYFGEASRWLYTAVTRAKKNAIIENFSNVKKVGWDEINKIAETQQSVDLLTAIPEVANYNTISEEDKAPWTTEEEQVVQTITQPNIVSPAVSNAVSEPINIYAGTNENADLSNFAVRPFTFKVPYGEEVNFSSVEQAFQYLKGDYAISHMDKYIGLKVEWSDDIRKKVLATTNGAKLKQLGRAYQFDAEGLKHWDIVSSGIMEQLLKASFEQNKKAADRLLSTGNSELTHTQDKGRWGKEFPKLLMEVRDGLRSGDIVQPITLSEGLNSATIVKDDIKDSFKQHVDRIAGHLEVKYVGENEIVHVPSGTTLGNSKAMLIGVDGRFVIYVNKSIYNPNMYNTLLHEGTHFVLRESLNQASTFYNKTFDLEMREVFKDLKTAIMDTNNYLNNQADLDRIFNLENFRNKESDTMGMMENRQIQEFLSHLWSGTSIIRDLANNIYVTPTKTFWGKVKDIIIKLLAKVLKTDKVSYLNLIEGLAEFRIAMPFNLGISTLMSEESKEDPGFTTNSIDPLSNVTDALEKSELTMSDVTAVRRLGKILSEEKQDYTTDFVAYVKALDFDQLSTRLGNIPDWIETAKTNYTTLIKPYSPNVSLDKYLKHLKMLVWESAQNLIQTETVRITINTVRNEDGKFLGTSDYVENLGTNYQDKSGMRKDGYKDVSRIFQRISDISQAIGIPMTVVALDDVKFNDNGKSTWKNMNSNVLSIGDRNNTYSTILRGKDYIYLGTWSDKNTNYAVKVETKEDMAKIEAYLRSTMEMYSQRARECAKVLFENGKITKDEFQVMSSTPKSDLFTAMRTMISDMQLGGMLNQNGQMQSVLYNPEVSSSYDLIKIFKRALEVAPLKVSYLEKERSTKIVNSVSNKSGIRVTDDGDILFNSFVFDSESVEGHVETVTIDGKQVTFNLSDILLNSLGTETTDGIIYYFDEGFGEVYRAVHESIKPGVIKAWIGNHISGNVFRDAFYGKSSLQLTNSPILKAWAKEHNVSLLVSSSSVKINNAVKKGNLLSDTTEGSTLEIPISAVNRQLDKKDMVNDAKGLAQSLTSNLMSANNPYFEDKGIGDAIDELLESLRQKYSEGVYKLSPQEVIKQIIKDHNSAETGHIKIATKVVLDMILSDKQKSNLDKILSGEYSAVDQITQSVNKMYNLFQDPYFGELLKSQIKDELSKIYNFRSPASWSVLRPDLGWLEPNNIEKIYNRFMNEKVQSKSINTDRTLEQMNQEKADLISRLVKARYNAPLRRAIASNLSDLQNEINNASVDDISEQTKEEIWKKVFEVVDGKTGRLKPGYCYLQTTYKNGFNLVEGDKIIATAVPSDGITAQQGVKIAAFIDGVDVNTVTLNSEHIQTVVGKDFDLDTIHIFPYDSKYMSYESYNKLWETITESNKKYHKLALEAYRRILEDSSLTKADIYTKPVQLKFMQIISGSNVDQRNVYSILHDSAQILNKFTKNIGDIINIRKIATTMAQMEAKSTIVVAGKRVDLNPLNKSEMGTLYLTFMRLTNDAVDMPTNINGLLYSLNPIKRIDMVFGTKFYDTITAKEEVNIDDPKTYDLETIDMVNAANGVLKAVKFLFSYGNKVTSDNNLENHDEKLDLSDTVKYIKLQQQINRAIDNGDNATLVNLYESGLTYKQKKDSSTKFAREYLENFDTENTTKASFALNAINNIELETIPDVFISKEVFDDWQSKILAKFREGEVDLPIEARGFLISENAKIDEEFDKGVKHNNIRAYEKSPMIVQLIKNSALLERVYPELNMLRWTVVSIMSPRFQKTYSENAKLNYLADYLDKANEVSYPLLMDKILNTATPITFFSASKESRGLTYTNKEGKYTIDLRNVNGNLVIEASGADGTMYHMGNREEFMQKVHSDDAFAKKIYNIITHKNGLLKDRSNRYKLTQLVNIERSILLHDRLDIAKEVLHKEFPKYTRDEQTLFWTSFLGMPGKVLYAKNEEGVQQKVPGSWLIAPHNLQRSDDVAKVQTYSTLFELASEFDSNTDFLKAYAKVASETYPSMNFSGINNIGKRIESEVAGEDLEIWLEELPKGHKEVMTNILNNYSGRENLSDIYETIDKSTNKMKVASQDKVFDTPNLLFNEIGYITGEQAYEARFFEKIRNMKPEVEVTLEGTNLAIVENLKTQFSDMKGKQTFLSHQINSNMEHIVYAHSLGQAVKNIVNKKSNRELREKYIGQAITFLEENPNNFEMQLIVDKGVHQFEFKMDGQLILEENIESALLEKGYTTQANSMESEHPDNVYAQLIALQLQKMNLYYANYIKGMQTYLAHFTATHPGFPYMDILDKFTYKYDQMLQKLEKYNGKYFPRVYTRANYIDTRREALKVEFPELDGDTIKEILDEELLAIGTNGGEENQDIDTFNFATEVKDAKKKYNKEDFSAIERMFKTVTRSIETDINFLLWKNYELEANRYLTDGKIISNMFTFFKLNADSKFFNQTKIPVKAIKTGDLVGFYSTPLGMEEEIYTEGVVEKVTRDRVFFKYNRDGLEQKLKRDLMFYNFLNSVKKNETAAVTTPVKEYYEELAKFGWVPFVVSNKESLLRHTEAIVGGIENKLKTKELWGSYHKSDIYLKEIRGDGAVRISGANITYAHPMMDSMFDVIRSGFSGMMVGWTSGASTNFIDAASSLIRCATATDFIGSVMYGNTGVVGKGLNKVSEVIGGSPNTRPNILEEIKTLLKSQDPNAGMIVENYLNYATENHGTDLNNNEEREMIKGSVIKYILENELLTAQLSAWQGSSEGTTANVMNLQDLTGSKIVQLWHKGNRILTTPFGMVEVMMRIRTAYTYAYKSVVLDKETDGERIQRDIRNGVAMSQGLYDGIYRKFGEATKGGKSLFQFHQYIHFQGIFNKSERVLMKEFGQTWDQIFSNKVINGEKNISRDMARKVLFDLSVGTGLQVMFPGLRVGNPRTMIFARVFSLLLNGVLLSRWDDDKEYKNILFGILSFYFGVGVSFPLQLIWNVVMNPSDPVPIHPRMVSWLINVYDLVSGKGSPERPRRPNGFDRMNKSTRFSSNFERSLTGFNFLYPRQSKYLTPIEQKYYNKTGFEKTLELFYKPVESAQNFLPVWNLRKTNKYDL